VNLRRRVLVLCYFYPPLAGGGVHRVLSFTRHLPGYGWDCTVVCAGEEDYWVRDESLAQRVPEATEVIRVPGGSALAALLKLGRANRGRRAGGAFGRLRRWSDWWLLPDSYVGWAGRARRAAAQRIARGGIDAVLSSSPPDSVHLAARALRRKTRIPWVADFRDPWIGLSFRTPPTAWHRARQQALECGVLRNADAVLVASRAHEHTIGAACGGAPDPARVQWLPNGFEPDAAPEPDADGAPAPHFVLVFTGTLAQMPDTEVFLEAVHEMLKRNPEARRSLRARLIGPYETGYADRAVALGLTPGIVEFQGPRDHARARAEQRAADVLLLWQPRGTPTMVPGKLYEYLEAGRPILAVADPAGESAQLARRGDAEVVRPADRDALALAIERRWREWRAGTHPPRARHAWLEEHRRDRLSGRLAATLDRLAEARR